MADLIHLDKERMKRRGDKPMGGEEKLDELVFLIDQGTHPMHAAQQLGTNIDALHKLARDHGRRGLARRLMAEAARQDPSRWRTA